jgi:hypothetical protein
MVAAASQNRGIRRGSHGKTPKIAAISMGMQRHDIRFQPRKWPVLAARRIAEMSGRSSFVASDDHHQGFSCRVVFVVEMRKRCG